MYCLSSKSWPLKHLTVSIEDRALIAKLDALAISSSCPMMLDCIFDARMERPIAERGIPAKVTNVIFHE
jgi:hypothetical protein